MEVGGIPQWLTIDGADCAQPVILIVHGGPGNPLSPYLDELYGEWQKTFTIATWDQRLSGKTYMLNEPVTEVTEERLAATELSVERLVADGIEVAEYLHRKFGNKKLILTGTSWGSVLGVHMVKQRPDLFHAYVGVSQLVNYRTNLAASFSRLQALTNVSPRRHVCAVTILEVVADPPWVTKEEPQ